MKKELLYITFFFFMILFISCHKQKPQSQSITERTICFEAEVRPIFKTYCASAFCHSQISNAGGYILDSFQNIISHGIIPGDTASSIIFQVLTRTDNTKMPKPPYSPSITDSQRIIIAKWILQGAHNTSNCLFCDTTHFQYKNDIQPLIQLKCKGCHGGATPDGGLTLGDYYNDSLAIFGIGPIEFMNDINYTPNAVPMPPSNELGKLSSCEISKIQNWINAGAQNN